MQDPGCTTEWPLLLLQVLMPLHRNVWGVAGAIALLGVSMGMIVWSSAVPVVGESSEPVTRSTPTAPVQATGGKVERDAVPASDALLVVVDDATGRPIADVDVYDVSGAVTRVVPYSEPPIGVTDREGKVMVPRAVRRVALRGRDHAAMVVETGIPEIEARMTSGHHHAVRVVDELGAPLSGRIVVCYESANALAFPEAYHDPGFGNPRSQAPLHVERTDAAGRAEFHGLRQGEYALQVVDRLRCPDQSRVTAAVPGLESTISLVTMHGIVVAGAVPIRHCRFEVPNAWTLESPCAALLAERTRSRLRERFPDCEVFVAFPMHGQLLPVRVRAFLVDGSVAGATWELAPLERLTVPVFLDILEPAGGGRLRVRLMAEGRCVAGVPLVATRRGGGPQVTFCSDDMVALPPGEYAVGVPAYLSWFDDALKGRRLQVQDGQDLTVDVPLPWVPVVVRIRAEFADGVVDVPMNVGVEHHGVGVSSCRFNLRTKDMPVEFWCPPGSVEVFSDAAHMERSSSHLQITGKETAGIAVGLVLLRR
jgi:hypothetical protein